jgi:hypothetical protein
MTTNENQFDRPVPPNAVCAQCGEGSAGLKWYCLTGNGDHPRRFLLCDACAEKVKAPAPAPTAPIEPTLSEAEMQRETRRQKAFARLGTDRPICVCCGETDWCCMELHHLEGKDCGKTLVCVCRNCHRKLSEAQKDHARSAGAGKPPLSSESIGRLLQGLADFLILIAEKLWEYGAYLIEHASTPKRQAKAARV